MSTNRYTKVPPRNHVARPSNMPSLNKTITVPANLVLKMMSTIKKLAIQNDRCATTLLKLKKKIFSEWNKGNRLRRSKLMLKSRLAKQNSRFPQYVKALKRSRLILNFQALHVRSLAKFAAQKDHMLQKAYKSCRNMKDSIHNMSAIGTSMHESYVANVTIDANSTLDKSVHFGDVTVISKAMYD